MLLLLLLLVTVGGGVLQSTVVAVAGVGGIMPDVPLILTVMIALRYGPESGCLAGFVAGLLQDVTGGGLVGVQALTKGLAGFGMGLLVGRFWDSCSSASRKGWAASSYCRCSTTRRRSVI
jgi:rod shape-determining protein MreD